MSDIKKVLNNQNKQNSNANSNNKRTPNKKGDNKNNNNTIYISNESVINLNQVNQKIKLEKQKQNSFYNKQKNNAEELLVQAFDPEEDFPLPENYVIDEVNEESINFLKRAKDEEKKLELNTKTKKQELLTEKTKQTDIVEKNSNKIPQIFQREEIIYNLNVNNKDIFAKNYNDFKISADWKKIILHEFNYLNSFFSNAKANKSLYSLEAYICAEAQKDFYTHLHLQNLNKSNKQFLTHEEIIKEFKLHNENINNIKAPASDNMSLFLALKLNNKNCIRLIKHFGKNLPQARNVYDLLMWIYMLISFLQLPLVDDDNSVLYGLNKTLKKFIEMSYDLQKQRHNDDNNNNSNYVVKTQLESELFEGEFEQQRVDCNLIAAKIVYTVISEFFNQRIIR